jgi:hypothetical protein
MSVELTWTPNGRAGNATITVEDDGHVVMVDTVNILKEENRKAFLRKLLDHSPSIDTNVVRDQLVGIASELTRQPERGDQRSEEVEAGRVVRPELFHLDELAGVAVPATVRIFTDDAPRVGGKWFVYVKRHHGGDRERVALSDQIEVDGGESIWFHPRPADPPPQTATGWSARGSTARRVPTRRTCLRRSAIWSPNSSTSPATTPPATASCWRRGSFSPIATRRGRRCRTSSSRARLARASRAVSRY